MYTGRTFSIFGATLLVLAAACSGSPEAPETISRGSSTAGTVTATTAPSASSAPTPQSVTAPTFVVTTLPVGCHETPAVEATIAVPLPVGSVQAMDQLIRQADGTWHREVDRQCWVRTDPGPVRLFRTLREARQEAARYSPQPVDGPTFVTNTAPVGCHETPDATARVVVSRPQGTVQAMDLVFRAADDTWHREVDRRCWTRTQPGPVRVFTSLEDAEAYAAMVRPPRRLANGTFLQGGAQGGLGRLTIENGRDLDAVAVLTTLQQATVFSVYIRAGERVTVGTIPDGSYRLYFTLGEDWDAAAGRFTRRPSFARFEKALTFQTVVVPGRTQYSTISVTLHAVPRGTATTEAIQPNQFPPVR